MTKPPQGTSSHSLQERERVDILLFLQRPTKSPIILAPCPSLSISSIYIKPSAGTTDSKYVISLPFPYSYDPTLTLRCFFSPIKLNFSTLFFPTLTFSFLISQTIHNFFIKLLSFSFDSPPNLDPLHSASSKYRLNNQGDITHPYLKPTLT